MTNSLGGRLFPVTKRYIEGRNEVWCKQIVLCRTFVRYIYI